jgi:hypothetical protein
VSHARPGRLLPYLHIDLAPSFLRRSLRKIIKQLDDRNFAEVQLGS